MEKTILIVDDSDILRNWLVTFIKAEGYNVLDADNGIDALGILNRKDIKADMIITDLNMPKMNGIELVRQLRNTPLYFSVPIVLITAESPYSKKYEAEAAGFNEWIQKPFSPMLLKKTIDKLLNYQSNR